MIDWLDPHTDVEPVLVCDDVIVIILERNVNLLKSPYVPPVTNTRRHIKRSSNHRIIWIALIKMNPLHPSGKPLVVCPAPYDAREPCLCTG